MARGGGIILFVCDCMAEEERRTERVSRMSVATSKLPMDLRVLSV